MEIIYSGIRNPDRTLAIGNALNSGASLIEVCQQYGVRKKTALKCADTAKAMQSHEIAITDGQRLIPLARIVVVGGGHASRSLCCNEAF